MKIEIHLQEQSQPIKLEGIENAYTKGGMYCVLKGGTVTKYPMCNIFRVKEAYT
jgi:hypothetical protein|tara:strand:+ start:74 stop:235 length:162 start_codon:yes stop_codon:yes gene_type:complete